MGTLVFGLGESGVAARVLTALGVSYEEIRRRVSGAPSTDR